MIGQLMCSHGSGGYHPGAREEKRRNNYSCFLEQLFPNTSQFFSCLEMKKTKQNTKIPKEYKGGYLVSYYCLNFKV